MWTCQAARDSNPTGSSLHSPSMNKALVMELARCEYIQRRDNVIAIGNQSRSVRPASGWACCRPISSAG